MMEMNPMGGGGPGMAPPPKPHGLGKKRKSVRQLEKIVDDNNGKILWKKSINIMWHYYTIGRDYTKRTLWFFSCLGVMYGFPMALEYMSESNRIMMKIMNSMQAGGADMMMGPPPGM